MSFFSQSKQDKPKSHVEELIDIEGVEGAISRLTGAVLVKIGSKAIAYQFVLEELEGANMGNSLSKDFVKKSGISPNEYKGAMRNSMIEVDGPEGPQQLLRYIGMQLSEPLRVTVSLGILEGVMKHFSFGSFQIMPLKNIRLKIESEHVEIVAVAVNEKIIYIDTESEDLYPIIMQLEPDSRYTHRTAGRAVVFELIEAATNKKIELVLSIPEESRDLKNIFNLSFAVLIENFPNLVSYETRYHISTYDDEDSRVMRKEGEIAVLFFNNLKIAYILEKNEYKKMPYRTYLSKYTDFDDYEKNLMNSLSRSLQDMN